MYLLDPLILYGLSVPAPCALAEVFTCEKLSFM